MTLSKLVSSCPCGGSVAPVNLFVTDDKALLVTGMCMTCNEQIKTQWPLRELYSHCPKPAPEPLRKPVKPPLQIPAATDADFLHSLGISDELPKA